MKTPPDSPHSKRNLENLIMDHIRGAERRHTPLDLERALALASGRPARSIRSAVKALVAENRLTYTQFLGHTFLEISYNRPVHVGCGVVLAPPDAACETRPGQTLIRIAPGAAFGMGDHATTRLALQLTAWSLRERRLIANPASARALDIGTGSGVLAIGACLMGINEAVGIDTDACARVEAGANARLNDLGNRVRITGGNPAEVHGPFSLILANLRYPTLVDLRDRILSLCAPRAVLIFSGFREHELPGLLADYDASQVRHLRTREENGWVGIVMQRTDQSAAGSQT